MVHTWIFAANSYGRLAAIRQNIPVVLGGERCIDSWKRGYEFWIDRYLSRRSQGIITNSRGVVDFYARHGIDPNKFFVIPNGVDPIVEKGISREEACKRLGIPKDRRIIAVIGRLWHQKNHKDIFWAIELLRVARNDLALVVIGDGPLRKRLELYRDQLRAADTIRLVGERSDVHDLLPHFEVVINSSFEEGQSNVIMEAMANGIPVVASDIPGNRDLVLHGNTGFLFPLGATHELAKLVHRLLEEDGLRQTFGDAAKQRIAELFSHDQMVRAHEELYLRLSNGS